MNRANIPRQALDFQKQILDFQRTAFENGYDAIVALQQRQLELADRMMNQAPNLPDEARELIRTWRDAAEESQRQFKTTVDGSFDAVTAYLDRLAGDSGDADAPAAPSDEPADQASTEPQAQEETAQ